MYFHVQFDVRFYEKSACTNRQFYEFHYVNQNFWHNIYLKDKNR